MKQMTLPTPAFDTALGRQFVEGSALTDLARRMKVIGINTSETHRVAHSTRLNGAIQDARARFQAAIGDPSFDLPEANPDDEDAADTGLDLDNPKLINAASRLKTLYFKRFKVRPTVFSKETGAPSLDENALKQILASPLYPPAVKEATRSLLLYREAQKTYSTYVVRLAHDAKNKKGDNISYLWGKSPILHATWNPLQARTGRWSCSDPNLMNVQKAELNEEKVVIRPGMRDMFCVRDPEHWIIEADYKQLEVRIIAALAGCVKLLDAFNSGKDIYQTIAAGLFMIPYEKVSKRQRGMAKIFVLASNYGGGIPVIHSQMVVVFPDITPKQCEHIQKRFFAEYPEIPAYQKRMFKEAKETGYVLCPISGRKAWFYLDRVKPTEAANYPIQGSAADIINPASIRLDRMLDWKVEWLIMQIHDALYLETRDVARGVKRMRDAMEGTIKLGRYSVRFDCDFKVGKNWGEMEDYKEAA
jgi:DNA polymerase I-like protein with 3'-5' exonuclease and polymerase domains